VIGIWLSEKWKWRKDEKARQNESFEGCSEKKRCQKVPKKVQGRKKVSYVILIRNNVTRACTLKRSRLREARFGGRRKVSTKACPRLNTPVQVFRHICMIRVHNPLNFNTLFTLVSPKAPLFPGLASPAPLCGARQGRSGVG